MMRSLRSLLGRSDLPGAAAPAPATPDAPQPLVPVYVVGDLHGRSDLLERMLTKIDAHVGAVAARDPHVIFVGDYIDMGPDSARVLDRVRELQTDFPRNVTCLMGNHERMMLDFLDDPVTRGPRWLRSGGRQTLDSFGVHTSNLDLNLSSPAETFAEIGAALEKRLPAGLHDWLSRLPLKWSSGSLWVVHAAADPHHRMEDQSPRVLLWGHPEFQARGRADGIWVAHGHTAMEAPEFADGRICVDTGAWETGRLTTCAVHPDGSATFLTA